MPKPLKSRKRAPEKKNALPLRIEQADFEGKIRRLPDRKKQILVRNLLALQHTLLLNERVLEEKVQREDRHVDWYNGLIENLKSLPRASSEEKKDRRDRLRTLIEAASERKREVKSKLAEITQQQRRIARAIEILQKYLASKIAKNL